MVKGLASTCAVAALFTAAALSASKAAYTTYLVEPDADGFVSLYNVSHVIPAPDGFVIESVVVGRHSLEFSGLWRIAWSKNDIIALHSRSI